MEFKCPRCGSILEIKRIRNIDEKRREVQLYCSNCDLEFTLEIEKKEVKEDLSPKLGFDVPEDTPLTLKNFLKTGSNASYQPFYLKVVSPKKPKEGIRVDELDKIGVPGEFLDGLKEYFKSKEIHRLYKFQENAIRVILEGKNTLITAPTGTGKTESFAIPSFIRVAVNKEKDTEPPFVLIIYPTKALARDQLEKLKKLCSIFNLTIDVLDGDTTQYKRRKIRANPPDVLITNFDMINYHLANRTKLSYLFTRAQIIIMDEAHEYTGAFGTHVYYILKRLKRLSKKNIQLIMSSATIHNAEEFASLFFDGEFTIIREEGRKTPLYTLYVYPYDTTFRVIAQMVAEAITKKIKTLAFLNTRKNAELTLYVLNRLSRRFKEIVNLYDIHRGGLPKKVRNEIENQFRTGKKIALIATPTLELGIDIGDLDLVISEITPIDNFIQRAGRAGRRDEPGSAVLVLRLDDPISEYYYKHPEDYFKDVSLKYIEPNNEYIAERHIYLAAYEKPLQIEELKQFNPPEYILKRLFERGSLIEINNRIYANKLHFKKYFSSNIRGSDKVVKVMLEDRVIDEREAIIAIRELHPNAIYVNRGRKYIAQDLDLKNQVAHVIEADPNNEYLYTKPLYSYSAVPLKVHFEKETLGTKVFYGLLRLTAYVYGYLVFREGNQKPIREELLEEPITYEYNTYGIFFKAQQLSITDDEKLAGSYHATEHILIEGTNTITGGGSEDLGGISFGTTGIIVIYDGTPGGNGVSKLLFDRFERAVERAHNILLACKETYRTDFNKCVYSYRCGNNNQPLHAEGALKVLEMMLEEKPAKLPEETVKLLSVLDKGYV